MSVIPILILISLALALVFLGGFIWAVRSGQYEDTYTPSLRMLLEEAGQPAARAHGDLPENVFRKAGGNAAPCGTGSDWPRTFGPRGLLRATMVACRRRTFAGRQARPSRPRGRVPASPGTCGRGRRTTVAMPGAGRRRSKQRGYGGDSAELEHDLPGSRRPAEGTPLFAAQCHAVCQPVSRPARRAYPLSTWRHSAIDGRNGGSRSHTAASREVACADRSRPSGSARRRQLLAM